MSNITKPSAENNGNYFLEEPERWEALGIDWQDWNATVEKILQRQATAGARRLKKRGVTKSSQRQR
jgi:hypothetical protein